MQEHVNAERPEKTLPPEEEIRRHEEEFRQAVVRTSIDTTNIANWSWIVRYAGMMRAALRGNFLCRQEDLPEKYLYPEKGFYFYGGTGRYKSYVARTLARFLGIPFYETHEIESDFLRWKDEFWKMEVYKGLRWGHCVIDDMGAESGQKVYGNIFPFSLLLKKRMDLKDRYGFTTIITSNFALDNDLQEADERTYSCIMGMCLPLAFGGDDARLRMKKIF